MAIRGIRGAITADSNTKENILENTTVLLQTIVNTNQIEFTDIASIFFSVTADLNATFPALSAREMGMSDTPLLCLNEIDVPDSLQKCIRILVHVNTEKPQSEMQHSYLKEAHILRPDQRQ